MLSWNSQHTVTLRGHSGYPGRGPAPRYMIRDHIRQRRSPGVGPSHCQFAARPARRPVPGPA
eukprot:390617-Hanusia_phi.AAC.1